MAHTHAHGLSGESDARRLGGAFALIVTFMVAELVAGILGSSLALISDAGHMLTDAVALGWPCWRCGLPPARRRGASPTG
jgi:cobalt-zinc-cadmium efflux system protein